MSAIPEFSRLVRVDTLSAVPRSTQIEADEQERAALARRFELIGIEMLRAEASLTRVGEGVRAGGTLRAAVIQNCVATGVPVPAELEETFSILFRPQPVTAAAEEELSEGEMDVVFYEGGAVDLGEGVAETLFLSLDAYPRAPESDAALKTAGVLSEEEAAPLSPLAGLKDLLEGKKKP